MLLHDLRQRLKSSFLYDAYWSLRDPEIIRERDRELNSYRKILRNLPTGALVFDVGANHGYKVDMFLRLGASVVAIDPDPCNQKILAARFHKYRLRRQPVSIVDAAVSDTTATAEMWIDMPGSAKNTLSSKWVSTLRNDDTRFGETLNFSQRLSVRTATLADLTTTFGAPFFVKIDVEGHEPAVIAGITEPVPVLSFEVNLPEFRAEGRHCLELLSQLDKRAEFNYCTRLASGCALTEWIPYVQMDKLLASLSDPSVEIFCRSPDASVSRKPTYEKSLREL